MKLRVLNQLGPLFVFVYAAVARGQDLSPARGYAAYAEILGDIGVSWSPDDSKLVYASQAQEGPKAAVVYIVPARGGKPVRLLEEERTWSCCGPAWSPDGQRIAFLSNRSTPAQLWTS